MPPNYFAAAYMFRQSQTQSAKLLVIAESNITLPTHAQGSPQWLRQQRQQLRSNPRLLQQRSQQLRRTRVLLQAAQPLAHPIHHVICILTDQLPQPKGIAAVPADACECCACCSSNQRAGVCEALKEWQQRSSQQFGVAAEAGACAAGDAAGAVDEAAQQQRICA